MRRAIKLAVIGTAFAFAIISPAGAWMTGNELHQDCLPSSDSFSPGMCLGYIEGVGHPLVAAGALCNWSPEVTHTQTRDVVVSYLRDHPADRHADAYWLVTAALQSAWPYHQ